MIYTPVEAIQKTVDNRNSLFKDSENLMKRFNSLSYNISEGASARKALCFIFFSNVFGASRL
jgi:hypothetical protein